MLSGFIQTPFQEVSVPKAIMLLAGEKQYVRQSPELSLQNSIVHMRLGQRGGSLHNFAQLRVASAPSPSTHHQVKRVIGHPLSLCHYTVIETYVLGQREELPSIALLNICHNPCYPSLRSGNGSLFCVPLGKLPLLHGCFSSMDPRAQQES